MAVIEVNKDLGVLCLKEVMAPFSVNDVLERTDAPLVIDEDLIIHKANDFQ
jgi:acetate CoA/acetoacetate CoA-transferase beta subunit